MHPDEEHASCCGDEVDEATKLELEDMPENYGYDEWLADQGADA